MSKKKTVFQKIKWVYRELRWEQRSLIVKALKDKDYIVQDDTTAGHGVTDYSHYGKLDPTFNLNNWIWIAFDAKDRIDKEKYRFVMSLNPPIPSLEYDYDIALYDRIGLMCNGDGSDKVVITEFELPLVGDDIDRLIVAVNNWVASVTSQTP